MTYEVCENCYDRKTKGHVCDALVVAKDDLCPKCLLILDDCSKAVGNYSEDMLQIQREAANTGGLSPALVLGKIRLVLKRREDRLLKEMEDGKIKRN